jgi:hypothetical protein
MIVSFSCFYPSILDEFASIAVPIRKQEKNNMKNHKRAQHRISRLKSSR